MKRRRPVQPVQRILLTRQEAAEALGISLRSFERNVQPYIRLTISGQLKLVSPSELERWATEHSRAPVA